eukprot:2112336-Alexandrium_andersonii.AAC.1
MQPGSCPLFETEALTSLHQPQAHARQISISRPAFLTRAQGTLKGAMNSSPGQEKKEPSKAELLTSCGVPALQLPWNARTSGCAGQGSQAQAAGTQAVGHFALELQGRG